MEALVENEVVQDAGGVWVLKGHERFGYSDGIASEIYLDKVLSEAKDLSSDSCELAQYIKDWTSEYHLTVRRAQLLAGFEFDRKQRVLEVGCGCGAITRLLAERFDEVISVEGNLNRARLARARTRDLSTGSVICAPFQSVRFKQKFDIIFCIGVFEYSGAFIEGDDPYEAALEYFSEMLTPNGKIVIAIENQFGLKYFAGLGEDHIGRPFEGIEGYHRRPVEVRTFGRQELRSRLLRHFASVDFYYPFPDYKIPDAVMSSSFVESGRAGEMVSQMRSRDYANEPVRMFNEGATALELARNGLLGEMSNSFIAIAGRGEKGGIRFEQEAILYSHGRKPDFSTVSRVVSSPDGAGLSVEKRRRYGTGSAKEGRLSLTESNAVWIDGASIQTEIKLRALNRRATLEQIFGPAKGWVEHMRRIAGQSGQAMVGGEHIDSIWMNAYVTPGGIELIDREWSWSQPIAFNVLVARAIYDFLQKIADQGNVAEVLQRNSGARLLREIAAAIGVTLTPGDLRDFIALEAEFQSRVFGIDPQRQHRAMRLYMTNRRALRNARSMRDLAQKSTARAGRGLSAIARRLRR